MRKDVEQFSRADVFNSLKSMMAEVGAVKAAVALGYSSSFLYSVIAGGRALGDKLALRLGFEKVPDAYVRAQKKGKPCKTVK